MVQEILALPHGNPSHDTFNRVFERLDSALFRECFLNWIKSLCNLGIGEVIAIDGKTLKGSRGQGNKALPIISAWACENQNFFVKILQNLLLR
jgi:hypothetical protein